ncbi:NADH-quinone oxidoreductase subunit A [Humisphaera borealis]|uniref:NADH-quinone oxidoreductase subunit A n=1 Tax=Humisphaera borealis TaxID=2807512 RepID=A0A7M2WPT6_9BACT|nr:NADH-quinone oxidoreductase subunit A [Humisphaera borealis]QOV87535.1 NADH-quinone oxidoreductase subunit A [Humisphaera borealis]
MSTLALLPYLAQTSANEPRVAWAPVVLLLIMGIGFAVTNVALSIFVGPKNTGPGKEQTYESGMVPVGTAHQRFNVRFYIVAMIFLVFDVDIIFMYPWATIFTDGVRSTGVVGGVSFGTLLLLEMGIFVLLLLVAYLYAWGKGVFKWD